VSSEGEREGPEDPGGEAKKGKGKGLWVATGGVPPKGNTVEKEGGAAPKAGRG